MNFLDDKEKMQDFIKISKDEFLKSYSYLDESDYLDTQKEINKKMKKNIEAIKDKLVLNEDILSINLYFYEDDNFDNELKVQNCFLYLAEKYNIEIPETSKDFIRKKLIFYKTKENTFSFINNKYDEKINVRVYLNKIKEKVIQERTINIKFIGIDSWSLPVYEDEKGNLYKDTSLGKEKLEKSLCTAYQNDFYGEPYIPLKDKKIIINLISNEKVIQKYKVLNNHNEEYKYNVQIWRSIDGGKNFCYAGEGKFVKTKQELDNYLQQLDAKGIKQEKTNKKKERNR